MITGFTCSCFDLLHAGHILMLEDAKKHCDYLIVGLQTDPTIDRPEKNVPLQSVSERYIQLAAVKYVDEIIPYSTENELLNLLHALPIDVRIIGEEYKLTEFTGNNMDMKYHYNKRRHSFSSSELRKRINDEWVL